MGSVAVDEAVGPPNNRQRPADPIHQVLYKLSRIGRCAGDLCELAWVRIEILSDLLITNDKYACVKYMDGSHG